MAERAYASDWLEDVSSLLPAVTLLQNLGYTYLPPDEALALRGGKRSRVVLEHVLADWLRTHSSFEAKGQRRPFSEANIQRAVTALSQHPFDALNTTAQAMYDLITLGKSLEETVDGDRKSYDLAYIDWEYPENNVFHVSDEFEVERRGSTRTRRPDVVVFVNGIPLAVIECKRPDLKDPLDEAISQHLRNHRPDEIPELFCAAQLLLAVSQSAAKYGTTATDKAFWAVWREEAEGTQNAELERRVNMPPSAAQRDALLSWRDPRYRQHLDALRDAGGRLVSAQDRTLHSLLRPERLLELIQGFVVFDAGEKKVARYQQYFAVKATLARVAQVRDDGTREGGVIWHTTGSGKSLTMVMLGKALALSKTIPNPKVILVNDRIDLDDQLRDTFKNCGAAIHQAASGKHLLELVNSPRAEVVTTVIDKFEGVARERVKNPSPNIFLLVDESHRSQYGKTHALMRTVFPNGCYLGFTGTPLLKKEKSTATKFGGFIHTYTMPQAVADGAVVPLLYEGRDSEFRNTEAVDKWFERVTHDLNPAQKGDLKRKFRTAEPLFGASERLEEIAYDVGKHFKETFVGTPFKGQFAVSSKAAALAYKKRFDAHKLVTTEVMISAPDTREDNESADEGNIPEVQRFWRDMMARHGSPEKYQHNLISRFKTGDEPHILIVVDKLLTGFDAPRNAVLYLDKRLKEHNILQAVARVNRVFEGKDYGLVIDYRGIFGDMNEALELYAALEREGFDLKDVQGGLLDVGQEIATLPTKHGAVWSVFANVDNTRDLEAMQRSLEPVDRRDGFYDALAGFAKTLQLALANPTWQDTTPDTSKRRYTGDLKYFLNLRAAVKQRYAESVDYSAYEAQLKNIIETHIGAADVKVIVPPVSIFEVERFELEVAGVEGEAAKADTIAARVKKSLTETLEEDPTFSQKFSELIQATIDAHRAKRLSDAEYLARMREHLAAVKDGGRDHVPEPLRHKGAARAYYGVLSERLAEYVGDAAALVSAALQADAVICRHKVRDWPHNSDVQNRMLNDLDDLFHDLGRDQGASLPYDVLDEIAGKLLNIAKVTQQ